MARKTLKQFILNCAKNNDYEAIRSYFAEHPAEIKKRNDSGATYLNYFLENRSFSCASALIKSGADVNFVWRGCTPLMQAASQGSLECLKTLVEHGAEVNAVGTHGWTAAGHAAKAGHYDCLRYLLEHKAHIFPVPGENQTMIPPLFMATKAKQLACVELLLEHGSPVDFIDRNGNTAMSAAIRGNSADIIQILVTHGSNTNQKWGDGGAPIYLAMQYGKHTALEALLEAGASLDMERPFSALFSSCSHHRGSCIKIVLRHLANRAGFYPSAESILAIIPSLKDAFKKSTQPGTNPDDYPLLVAKFAEQWLKQLSMDVNLPSGNTTHPGFAM